jgi:hypothetical protein
MSSKRGKKGGKSGKLGGISELAIEFFLKIHKKKNF